MIYQFNPMTKPQFARANNNHEATKFAGGQYAAFFLFSPMRSICKPERLVEGWSSKLQGLQARKTQGYEGLGEEKVIFRERDACETRVRQAPAKAPKTPSHNQQA